MKKLLLFSFLSILTSCNNDSSNDNDEKNTNQSKVSLVITEDYTSTNKTWDIYANRFESDEFFTQYPVKKPIYPTSEITAYFINKETTGQYKAGDVVKSITMNIGTNNLNDLPRLKYDVVVTNYKKYVDGVEDLEWFKKTNAVETLPNLSDEMYLYSKISVDYTTETVAEVKLKNHYSMLRVLKYYISVNDNGDFTPYQIKNVEARISGDEKSTLKSDDSLYNYIYTRTNTNVVFKIDNSGNSEILPFNTMSANNVYVIIPYVYRGDVILSYREFEFDDSMLK